MSPEQMEMQDIKVAPVAPGQLQRHIVVPGMITPVADRIARVPARVVGTVAEMRKQLGDAVKADEIVAVLDSREVADAKSEYLTARVNLDLQTTNFERAKALWERRVSAESQYLQAQATFSEAQLRLDLARQKLSALGLHAKIVFANSIKEEQEGLPSSLRKYELRAPIAGRIIERKVDVGTAVGKEGDPSDVYTIADLTTMWAELSVATIDLALIKEGAAVSISPAMSAGTRACSPNAESRLANELAPVQQVGACPLSQNRSHFCGTCSSQPSSGKIVFISPVLSADTKAARVIAGIPNADGRWHAGSFATAEIEIARDEVPLMLPKDALQTINGKTVVFVRTADGFEKRDIARGRKDDYSIEIVSGLKAGEEIAISNSFLLKAELGKSAADD